ncbi:Alpha-L-fucosidase [compost metagenome]|uniref:alpha-L-fucosidase n=1 Tax=Cupriavidus necator TaxID=106590 RepID=UPI0028B6523D
MQRSLRLWQLGALAASASLLAACGGDSGADGMQSATSPASLQAPAAADDVMAPATATREQTLAWYKGAKFGMFVHWGLYSPIAKGEWALSNLPQFNDGQQAGVDAYKAYASQFDPDPAAIRRLVALAKDTGMQYIVLVTRHHDGFSLWNTKADAYSSDFNSQKQGAHVDMVRRFAQETEKQGIKLVLYYSLLDWTHPDYPVASSPPGQPHLRVYENQAGNWDRYRTFMKTQLRELLTQYGQIAGIWFDGYWAQNDKSLWQLPDLYATIRQAQPGTLIGNNHGIGLSSEGVDDDLTIGERGGAAGDADKAGETVDTSQTGSAPGGTWGYVEGAGIRPREWVFEQLIGSISAGKNFVLNVGPRADGSWQDALGTEFSAVGAWMRRNAEAVYGTRAGVMGLESTQRTGPDGKTWLYLFVRDAAATQISLPTALAEVRSASTLTGATALPVRRDDAAGTTQIDLSSAARTPREPLVLKLDATVPVLVNLSRQATATATSTWSRDPGYGPEMAIDGNPATRWASEAPSATLTQVFAAPASVQLVQLAEYLDPGESDYRTGRFTVEANVNGQWQVVASGSDIGQNRFLSLPGPVVASALRINVVSRDQRPPSLYSFVAYAKGG